MGHLPRAVSPLPRLPKGQEHRAREGQGTVRHTGRAHKSCASDFGITTEQVLQLLGTDDERHGEGFQGQAIGQGEDEG